MVTTRGAKKRQEEQEDGKEDKRTERNTEQERVMVEKVTGEKVEETQKVKEQKEKAKESEGKDGNKNNEQSTADEDTEDEEIQELVTHARKYLSKSWITINAYGDKLHYQYKFDRLPTMHWYSLSYELRVRCTEYTLPLMSFEEKEIEEAVMFAITRYGIQNNYDLAWKLARGIGKDIQKKRADYDWEIAAMLSVCMRFSKTPLEIVKRITDDEQIGQELEAFWIAAQQNLGCNADGNKTKGKIYELSKTKPMDSVWWDRFRHLTREKVEASDFHKVGPKNPWKEMDLVNCRNGVENRCWSVDDWDLMIRILLSLEDPDESDLFCIKFFVKLANSPPENIPGWNFATRSLENNPFSMVWTAVHNVWGRTWKREVTFQRQTTTPSEPRQSGVASSQRKKKKRKIKKIKRQIPKVLYVNRDNTEPKVYKLDDKWKRCHVTYIKIKIPPIPEVGNYNQQAEEKVEDFLEALRTLWEVDPSLTVRAWLEFTEKDPLHKDSVLQSSRAFIAPYVERFYGSRSKGGSYIRTKIAHDLPMEEIWKREEIKTMKEEKDIVIYEDKIQARKIRYLGWWAGSINSRQAIHDLEWTLKNQPLAIENNIKNIEIRIGIVNNEDKFQLFDENDRVFAMQLYCEEDSALIMHEIVMSLYPAKPQATYPLGRHMRFVSNVNDNELVHAPDAYEKAELLRRKQGIFLSRLRTVSTRTIRKLHRELPVAPYASMTEMIMAWKSPLFPDERLFVAVEEQYGVTTFHFLKKHAKVAKLIVPILEIILEKEFGPEIKEWFEVPAQCPRKRFTYSKESKRVTPVQFTKRSEEWNVGIEDSDSEMSEGEIFQVDVGRIDLQPREMESPLDDESIGTLGAITEEEEDDFSSEEEDEFTEQSSVTATIATQEPRNLNEVLAEKKTTGKSNDKESEGSSVTATIATKSKVPAPISSQKKGKEDEDNESTQSSVTMSIVSAVEGRENRLVSKKLPPPAPNPPGTDVDDGDSDTSSVTASIATRTDPTPVLSLGTKLGDVTVKGATPKEKDSVKEIAEDDKLQATEIPTVPDTTVKKVVDEEERSEQSSVTASIATKHDPPPIVSPPEKKKPRPEPDSIQTQELTTDMEEKSKISKNKKSPQQNDRIPEGKETGDEVENG